MPAGLRTVATARLPGDRSYQPAILAEFLIAVLVVALVPIARPREAKTLSPYNAGDMYRFFAIGALYFILALMSSSARLGRFAAWFGGFILLVIGLGEVAEGNITPLFKVFTGPGAAKETAAPAAAPAPEVEKLPLQAPVSSFPYVPPGG